VTAAQLHKRLKPVLPADLLLISDGAVAYRHFDAQTGIRARGAIHSQNVNRGYSRFKSWLVRCREPLPDPLFGLATVPHGG
jgi:hypothetical protein